MGKETEQGGQVEYRLEKLRNPCSKVVPMYLQLISPYLDNIKYSAARKGDLSTG